MKQQTFSDFKEQHEKNLEYKNFSREIEELTERLEFDMKDIDARLSRAVYYLIEHNYQNAYDDFVMVRLSIHSHYHKVQRMEPHNIFALMGKAECEGKMGKTEESLKNYTTAIYVSNDPAAFVLYKMFSSP